MSLVVVLRVHGHAGSLIIMDRAISTYPQTFWRYESSAFHQIATLDCIFNKRLQVVLNIPPLIIGKQTGSRCAVNLERGMTV